MAHLGNVAFTIFAIYLLLSIYIFATYLQGANLCKSFFSAFRTLAIRYERLELTDTILASSKLLKYDSR